jgi:alpha-mannosidase
MPAPQPCFVFRYNHFDPLWRRCWDRDFIDEGRRFVSYRAIEEAWLDDALATVDDGESCFMVEASWVLRHYLERHPERAATLRALAQAGRVELLAAGENIIDINLVHGEMIARNLLLGVLWGEQTLGVRPTTGWHGDGFGSSAQLPQLFRQCGVRWVPAISYSHPDAPYWRGLDGSTILFNVPGKFTDVSGTTANIYHKHAPCPACQGYGCAACHGRGFLAYRAELNRPLTARLPVEAVLVGLWGEEILPGLGVTEAIAALNASQEECHYRHGIYRDLYPYLADALTQLDAPPAEQISSKVENNPTQCGCWVTRIRCKQAHRRAEHGLLAAEVWDTLLTGGAGAGRLREQWRRLTLSAFHDSITSSHVDPAHDELLALLADIQDVVAEVRQDACQSVLSPEPSTLTLFNHHGFAAAGPVTITLPAAWAGVTVRAGEQALPVFNVIPWDDGIKVTFGAPEVPALGAKSLTLAEGPLPRETLTARTVECGDFTVEVGDQGLTRVAVAGVGTVAAAGDFLIGELLLETDEGDPWGTRSLERTRERISPYTTLAGIEAVGESVVIRYTGAHPANGDPFTRDPKVTFLAWEQTVHLRAGVPWLEVETTVDWYTQDRRLRLAFPSVTRENRGVYEIPFGVLARDRYEATSTKFAAGNGDWPAIHWAGIQAPGYTFAIFNQGTPSYRVEDGTVLVSVLRSPTIPCCLLEPASYVAHNYFGMMDHGRHKFRHALYIGRGEWQENDTLQQAALFNGGLTALPGALTGGLPAWGLDAAHTQLVTIKPAEDGHGTIVRLVESAGRPETIRLHLPQASAAWTTNLLEDNEHSLVHEGDGFLVDMAPWTVVTVRVG